MDLCPSKLYSWCRDQRLYKQEIAPEVKEPVPVTAEDTGLRFADGVVDSRRNRIILVQEDHSKEGIPVNTLSAIGEHKHHHLAIAQLNSSQ